jgi:hypothetical protein
MDYHFGFGELFYLSSISDKEIPADSGRKKQRGIEKT